MSEETGRCTGHCCKAFCIPDWADPLLEMACFLDSFGIEPGWGGRYPDIDLDYQDDLLKIADMIIPLGMLSVPEVEEIIGCAHTRRSLEMIGDSLVRRFTCRHLSPEGNCTNYEDRPEMCSVYPSSGRCEWAGCTNKDYAYQKTTEAPEFEV